MSAAAARDLYLEGSDHFATATVQRRIEQNHGTEVARVPIIFSRLKGDMMRAG